jgi:hypothetical protein
MNRDYEFEAPRKDPQSTLRHGMDWRDWLDEGETITGTPLVNVSPAGLTIDQVATADGVVSWRVSGGALGVKYTATCRITTSGGRTDERSILYEIGDR